MFKSINPLHLLYDYESLDATKYFNDMPDATPLYNEPYMGLINDPNYCDYTDTYNLLHPANLFSAMNIFNDYNSDGLAR